MTRPPVNEKLQIAIVSAVAAIGGGLVVAVATIWSAHETQRGENDRLERRLDEEARGASRVLMSQFATTLEYAGAALDANAYMSFRPEFIAPLLPADLKLVTGRLTADEFIAVNRAMSDTASFLVLFKTAGGLELSPSDRRNILQWRTDLTGGESALTDVADLSG